MKLSRIETQGRVCHALLEDGRYMEITGDIFGKHEKTGRSFEAGLVRVLAPVMPSKIVAVGKNYYDHVMEFDAQMPGAPIIFLKPPSSIVGPEEAIVRPSISSRIDYEGELAMVVRKRARNVKAVDFSDYILGYTILNDVTARDLQKVDGQWTRAKGFDTFAPIGPVITDEVDAENLKIETRLNGEIVQSSNTRQFLFKLGEVFEFVTRFMTLEPGDVITTGTPEGVGPMRAGDVVEIAIEGIGTLRNIVKDEEK